jgi:hypothetical protein
LSPLEVNYTPAVGLAKRCVDIQRDERSSLGPRIDFEAFRFPVRFDDKRGETENFPGGDFRPSSA